MGKNNTSGIVGVYYSRCNNTWVAIWNKDTVWKTYFDQSPDVWLKFLIPGNNTKNSIKSIYSLAHAELQLSK